MDAIAMRNSCYISTRRRQFYGFTLPKGFIYGNIDGVVFATSGTQRGGNMVIYTYNGYGWIATTQRISRSPIAKAVIARYDKVIADKNKSYKGSTKQQADKQREREKPLGLELSMRLSKPYDASQLDAKQRVYRACLAERRAGL